VAGHAADAGVLGRLRVGVAAGAVGVAGVRVEALEGLRERIVEGVEPDVVPLALRRRAAAQPEGRGGLLLDRVGVLDPDLSVASMDSQ
jgi:hypothetical protein